jgi:Osmosensitive K+ channel histidine kinase
MNHTQDDSSKPLILIVEDSRAAATELKRSIEASFDLRVEVAATYPQARAFLEAHTDDIFLAILDLNLPGAKPGDIVDIFRERRVPSIVFTSDFSESTRKRMLARDIIDYVVKDAHAVRNIVSYIKRLMRNRAIRVLVVEDSTSFCAYLRSLLEQQMFQVVAAASAGEALDLLGREEGIGLVITDFEMPGMNGVELTRRIRADHSKERLPVIGLSAVSNPMLSARFIKNGANDFLAKPFEAEEFYCRVDHNVETMVAIKALREANEVKNQFLGMAAHDLRSPISGIKGMCEMMLEELSGPLNSEQRELLEFIHSANEHMNALVSDLLDISVIEAGALELLRTKGDLKRLIELRLRVHSIGAKKKSLVLTSSLDNVPEFSFDSRRVGQVLDNLLTNAMKFSPQGGSIEVSLRVEGGEAVVAVRDHGQGVPPGEEELLFQSFKQTSVRPTAGESGTGLGLPIVKKIVEAHGGRVWAESVYGHGATFFFSLPMS